MISEAIERRQYRFARRTSRMTASAVREILKVTEQPDIISFAGGLPAPELFPVAEVARAHNEIFAEAGQAAMQYSTTEGRRPLREWIADRLRGIGIDADADRLLITTGSQQAISLVAKIFLDPGDKVVVENPTYLAALQAFNEFEASFIPIESDDDGMQVEHLEEVLTHSDPKLIYIVSEFSNPKGTTLSSSRRKQLIDLSRRFGVLVFEDDAYGELRYEGVRPSPLAALDNDGLVIYTGTFSKTLSPGMRIGWVLAPKEIFQMLVLSKQAADLHTCTIEQRAVERLLADFDYDGQLDRIRSVYGDRRTVMLDAIDRYFPPGCKTTRPEGGLFLWVELPEHVTAESLLQDALKEKVAFVPGAPFFPVPRHNYIRLNFSNCSPDKIEDGIGRIANVLRRRIG